MVKVIFLNLLRSKYNIKKIEVIPGTIDNIIAQIQKTNEPWFKENDGIQTKAAESLGISERNLRYKIKKYDIK